jgi:hypothetical protein
MTFDIWPTDLVVERYIRSSAYLISNVFFKTTEQYRRRHQPRRHHDRCAQASRQEVVPIPASAEAVRLDECRTSCASYERFRWLNYEWHANVDLLEQVRCHTQYHDRAALTTTDTSTTPPEPS